MSSGFILALLYTIALAGVPTCKHENNEITNRFQRYNT